MEKPLFSIIIPTYNHGKFIGSAIDSVRAQTFSGWEIVVVNDGSTDNTQEVIDGYSLIDARIHPVVKANGGTASAINSGLDSAQGDWICWLSSDDWYEPEKLEIHRRYIKQNPGCEFFFSHFHMFNEYEGKTLDRDLFGPLPEREFQIPTLFYRNYVMGVGICVSRNLWERVGRMDTALQYAQDYDMWLKMLTISPGCFIPERTFTYRHHSRQGSEIFQLACLFDASKSAIRYVNEHSFKDYFPLVDLSIHANAKKAVMNLLEVAGDPSAYIYSLGYHPALIMRTLEWISLSSTETRDELFEIVRDFGKNICKKYPGSEFGDMWRRMIETANEPLLKISFKPVSHVATGISHYFQCVSAKHPLALALKKYLENYEGIKFDDLPEHLTPDTNMSLSAISIEKLDISIASKTKILLKKYLRF